MGHLHQSDAEHSGKALLLLRAEQVRGTKAITIFYSLATRIEEEKT